MGMTETKFYVSPEGVYLGGFEGSEPPEGSLEVSGPPDDGRQVWDTAAGAWSGIPTTFKPIEPVPFWIAAWDLLQLKKSDIYAAIVDPDERYLAELAIEGRKTYLRQDPLVQQLANLKGYPAEEMDTLWVYVQEHYV